MLAGLNAHAGAQITTYSACRRSLGYSLARASALYPKLKPNVVTERWERLRHLTGLSVSKRSVEAVGLVNSAASKKTPKQHAPTLLPSSVFSVLRDFIAGVEDDAALSQLIMRSYPAVESIAPQLRGPFDSRMGVFLRIVSEIQSSPTNYLDDIAVGYFCNEIQPGTYIHSRVLAKLTEFFPTSLIWYGVFSALSSKFDHRNFGGGLFQKLRRDVLQSFCFEQRPRCDLSLDELEVLIRAPLKADAIKPFQQKIASIALLPGVEIFSRFSAEDDLNVDQASPSLLKNQTDPRLSTVSKLLNDALAVLLQVDGQDTNDPKRMTSRNYKKYSR